MLDMASFEGMPYTNLHNLNLNAIIRTINELIAEMNTFEAVTKISYKGEWDITKNYPSWSIVVDNSSGNILGYISKKPVPSGVDISNNEFWEMIADVTALYADLGDRVEELERVTKSYFTGKKIVSYGDSTIHNTGMHTYIDTLPEIIDCSVVNRGVAGTRMNHSANNGVSLINSATDLGDYDVITLSYGTNEWQTNETVKQIFDDAKALIEAIRVKNSDIDIVFILPSYAHRDFGNTPVNLNNSGLFLHDVNNVIHYVMSLYNIPVIDLYHESACNEMNYSYLLRNDSGGIYVHPEDWFSRNLAYIVKNFNTGAKPKIKERDILATYDFYEGQTAYTNTDYNNDGGLSESGLFLHYGGSYTEDSTMKTVLSSSIYRICGKSTHEFTLSCGTWSRTIPSGYFDFVVSGIPTGFASFIIDTNDETIISDFHIMNVYLGGKEMPDATRFGARCVLTKVSNDITALSGRYAPSVVFDSDKLAFDFSGFVVDNAVSASDVLFRIPYNFTTSAYLHSYIYAVKSSDGDVYPLELQANEIKALKAMPTGTYIISSNIVIDRNITLIN